MLLALPGAAVAQDQLPDLGMARLTDFTVDTSTTPGRSLLRYTATIVNTGAGKFELTGSRSSTTETQMSVMQRVFDSTGTSRYQNTPARMYFAGDGHNHWHVQDLEDSELTRSDNGSKVGSGAKHGFCFFDIQAFRLSLLGAPANPFYTTCGTDSTVTTQSMGLSIGWGDVYSWWLADQWVDITGLSPGRYRLNTTADKQNWFVESDETNNGTWVDLQLKAKGRVRVVGYGPSA